MQAPYIYSRYIHFYETDLMSVVHHSNYVRLLEEARVEWLRESGMILAHAPTGPIAMAVIEAQVRHHRPCFFNDKVDVWVQARLEKLKIRFQYRVMSNRYTEPVATGMTLHIPVNRDLKPARLSEEMEKSLSQLAWNENWWQSERTES